jgi:hypothetical protein
MVTKGKHTAHSHSFEAILQTQDKIKSTPTTHGNDNFPSPRFISVTQDEGAQRIIDTIHALLH